MEFNPLKPQILATAGTKGELFVYDVNDIENPFRLGSTAARSDDIECLAWNRKVSHILATGGSGGFVTVWDLKTKKASLTLNNSRKAVSAIAWDPNNSTKLLTATPDDNTPVILLWDLRNSNAPEKTLQGHEQGVLSLSWCLQDSDLLLSSGKDNRTLVWNPQTGEKYGEFPEVTNWTFLTRFNPHNPSLSATASFDGKITIQTLQNANPETTQAATGKNLDDEEFFRAAQTQPQGASWSLTKAPKWLQRPVGASFGFGGKLVIFTASPAQPGQKRTSKVLISQFSVDSDVSTATQKFQEALASGDLATVCKERSEQAKSAEEKADWEVMETLAGSNPRGSIVGFLGFKEDELTNGDETTVAEGEKEDTVEADKETEKSKGVSNFFDGGEGDGEEDFLSTLAANKGTKTGNAFQLFSDSDTSVEKDVTKALMLGNFAKATDICLKEDRIADAFLIANCGGPELLDKVQSAYLARKAGVPSYMRLLGSVLSKNLWDVVYNADLQNWKEAMAIVCTFSDPNEFPDLCEALGDRIHEQGSRKDASFCYLAGSKLEKVVAIWAAELEEADSEGMKQPSEDSTFSVHARSLQNFIEKVTVFRQVTKFQDNEKSLNSGWKLAALYDIYTEYADILAGHGQLQVAQKYLDLLPSNYPAADVARNRVGLATQKPAAQAASRQPAAASRAASRVQPAMGYQPPQSTPSMAPSNPYASLSPAAQAQAQAQQYMPPQNAYQPQGGYQPPGMAGYGSPMAPPPMAGPPRNLTPSGPPPSTAKNMDNWNDVPVVNKPPPRRSTPSVAPITSPFPGGQQGPAGPPAAGQFGQGPTHHSPPPPPKGPAPPRVQSPLAGPPRPSSSVANQYAPPGPQAVQTPQLGPNIAARTASPYNAPPPGGPPTNRYAPAPAPQQQMMQPPAFPGPPPPGPASRPPQSHAYGAPPQQSTPQNPYAASPYAPAPGQVSNGAQAPPPGPSAGPPPMGRPGPPPAAAAQPTPPPPKAAAPPPKPKHPAGDRSHIPASAQGLVDALDQDMQRIASKAPATFAPQVKDTQKRLNLLFDHLNNEELVQPSTIDQLSELARAIQAKDYATAQRLQVEIQRDKTDECGNWMVSRISHSRFGLAADDWQLGRREASHQHEQGDALRLGGLSAHRYH